MIPQSSSWIDSYAEIESVSDETWALKMSNWVFGQINNKITIPAILGNLTYTFSSPVFAEGLAQMKATTSKVEAASKIADAWERAIITSHVLVAPGASLGAPTPYTTWGTPPVCTVHYPSVLAAKNFIVSQLSMAPLVSKAKDSRIPTTLHKAFKMLMFNISGMSIGTPPVVPPAPLIAASLPCL